MPKYQVTDSVTGKSYVLEGDSPPTEQELEGIFAGQRKQAEPAKPKEPEGISRYANLIKQHADRGIAGFLGMAGDINQGLNSLLGSIGSEELPVKGLPLPTTDTVYNTLFAPPEGTKVTPQGFGEEALAFGSELIPSLLLSKAMPKQGMPWLKQKAESLYASGLKPSTTLTPAERSGVVKTLMKERIPYTEKGAQKLLDLKAVLSRKVDEMVKQAPNAPQRTVADLMDAVDDLKNQFADVPRKSEIWAALDDYKIRLLDVYGKGRPNAPLTTQYLHKIKKDLYKLTEYGKDPFEIGVEKGANKAVAKVAKEGVEAGTPKAKEVNKRLADLYKAEDPLMRAAGRTSNYEPLSPFDIIAGIATGQPASGIATAGAMRASRLPGLRSSTAFALDSLASSNVAPNIRNLIMLELLRGRPDATD